MYNYIMNVNLSSLAGKRICAAISGGRDSVALTHYLLTHAAEYGYTLSAVNCEHGIRGKESLRDTAFVKELCARRGIKLYCFSENCIKRAKEERTSIESAARSFRYECFGKILSEGKADVIATAHHAGDNAETVLFNLCRGTALSGLRGISEREGFIRPFLFVTREEIDSYISENSLEYVEDSTNGAEDATRNVIRHKVISVLKDCVPGAVKNISRFSCLAAEDDDLLYSLSAELLTFSNGKAYIAADGRKPLFMRAALTALKELGVEKDYTYGHLLSVYDLIAAQNGATVCLPRGVRAVREYGKICLYIEEEKPACSYPFSMGSFKMGGRTVIITDDKKEYDENMEGGAFMRPLRFDISALPAGCVMRFRQNGDIFKKFGGGTKKLKEFLGEKKVPLKDRDFIPLIACGGEIFAVCGVEISDKIKCADEKNVCYIILK